MNAQTIEELNKKGILQTRFADEGFADSEEIKKLLSEVRNKGDGIGIDGHRHYETSIYVYEFDNDFLLGIRAISQLYSEMSSIDDIYHILEFYEMEEKEVVTYTIKKETK